MFINKGEIHPFFFGADMGSTLSVGTMTTLDSTYFNHLSHCGVTNKSFVSLNVRVRTVCGLQFFANVKHYVGLEADEINQLRFNYCLIDLMQSIVHEISTNNGLIREQVKQKLKSSIINMDLFGFDTKTQDDWVRTACDLLRGVHAHADIDEPVSVELRNLINEY